MEVSKPIELTRIDELRILHNVRLLSRHDLNPVYSKDNLRVQFNLTGEIQGSITCYLCLDGLELTQSEKNFLFPLFVESMNILVGRQVTLDTELTAYRLNISPPRLSMIPHEINSSYRTMTQKYDLELEDLSYSILTEYSLEAFN
jgi:hypothetical protein